MAYNVYVCFLMPNELDWSGNLLEQKHRRTLKGEVRRMGNCRRAIPSSALESGQWEPIKLPEDHVPGSSAFLWDPTRLAVLITYLRPGCSSSIFIIAGISSPWHV